MPSWREVEAEVPELAALARRFLDAHVHKTLATLRRDGSPRISGTEVDFADGELWLGSMWQAVKALDLRRDPRFALHSGSADPPDWKGDAKLAGRAEEITDPERKAAVIRGGHIARTLTPLPRRRNRARRRPPRRPSRPHRGRVLARGMRRYPPGATLAGDAWTA